MAWIATAVTVGTTVVAGQQARKQGQQNAQDSSRAGKINASTSMLNAEFEAFQVDQQAIANRMGTELIKNNVKVNRAFISFTKDTVELNARLALTDANTEQAIAEFNSSLAIQDKEQTAEEGSKDIEALILDRNQEMEQITAKFGASGISLDSATVGDVKRSVASNFGKEIDKVRYLSGVKQMHLNAQSADFLDAGERASIAGDLKASQILMSGEMQVFNMEQEGLELGIQGLTSETNTENLEFAADTMRKNGIANASTIVSNSLATASREKRAGALASTQAVLNGVGKVTSLHFP